jgi:hypothetical protein
MLITGLMLFDTTQVMAQTNDDTKFSISLGVFLTDRDSKTSIDGTAGMVGSDVDLEDDLGLDNNDSVFRVDAFYRFNDKHRLDFGAFDLSRSASIIIQTDIEWGDTVFPIDTMLDSNFDLAIYKIAYTWSFLQRKKGYLGVTAGLYIADFKTEIIGQEIGEREGRGTTAPLPVVGLRGKYDFTEKVSFRGSAEFFALEYQGFDGSLYDFYAGVDYQLFDHVAIGLGINSVRMDLGIAKNNFNGNLDWQYDGGLLFFKFDF